MVVDDQMSEAQMLAWLTLEGFRAYEGLICVGVYKGDTAYWYSNVDACVHTHPTARDVPDGVICWMGEIYDRPIHQLRKLFTYIQEHGHES